MKTLLFFTLLLATTIGTYAQKQLPLGTKAPGIETSATNGKEINLSELTKKQQVVLLFYRGQWCPYCNKQLSELQDSLQLITDLGATVIAITPEKPEEVEKTVEKTGASFDIIYDKNHKIMDDYQVTFNLSKTKNTLYKTWGIDINKSSGNDDLALPIPATYIISKGGKIKGSYFDDNYKNRLTVKEMIKILKQ